MPNRMVYRTELPPNTAVPPASATRIVAGDGSPSYGRAGLAQAFTQVIEVGSILQFATAAVPSAASVSAPLGYNVPMPGAAASTLPIVELEELETCK